MKFYYSILILLLFSINPSLSLSQKKITVMIDAGHGGSDPGNISSNSKLLQEKDINLLVANKFGAYVNHYLQNVDIIYTRTTDKYISLADRVELANSKNVDLFISIHCNASDRKSIHGTETHINSFKSKNAVEIARILEKEFSTRVGLKSRGVKNNDDREHSLQVLKFTKMTSVLVECGFMTNDKEVLFLNSSHGQDLLASALFRGLRTYLQKTYPKIEFVKSKTTDQNKPQDNKGGKFYVQISSSKEEISENHESFKRTGEKVIREIINPNALYKYRYVIGPFLTKTDAKIVKDKVSTKGFPDSIIFEKK